MTAERERFIPFARADLVRMCSEDREFLDLCRILSSVFHFEFHERLETLKALYAPSNPDADTRPSGRPEEPGRLAEALSSLLERGNYRKLSDADLEKALAEDSAYSVKVFTDLNDFAELHFFVRGRRTERTTVKRPFRKPIEVDLDVYERVVVFARFREAAHFQARKGPLPWVPGSTMLKLFRHVPCADLEMLLPNVDVRMRPIDRVMLGVPAAFGGLIVLFTKLSASLLLLFALGAFWLGFRKERVEIRTEQLVALGLGLLALGIHLFRSFGNFKNRKIRFMKALSESLYFRNLDNNAGVFHRLVDEAEEEETKEAVLAYHFLLQAPGITEEDLDGRVERWLKEKHNADLDFEVDDAMAKLLRLGLASKDAQGHLTVVPIPEAQRILDERWDNYFQYAG